MKTKKQSIKTKAIIKNEFLFKITEYGRFENGEADTSKIEKKWEAHAYNLITNTGLGRLKAHLAKSQSSYSSDHANILTDYNAAYCLGTTIVIGDGNTAPAATDTALDNQVSYKAASVSSCGFDTDNFNAYNVRKATWAPADAVGEDFKEVGLAPGSSASITSRALIVDSEGDPLTISKTSTMQIEIYYKIYIVATNSDTNVMLVGDSQNNFLLGLIAWGGSNWNYYPYSAASVPKAVISVGTNSASLAYTDAPVKSIIKSLTATITPGSGYDLTYNVRFGTSEGNGKIKEIGAHMAVSYVMESQHDINYSNGDGGTWRNQLPLFRAILPLTGIYTGTTFTDHEIGTGDGTTTDFTLTETDNTATSWLWNEISAGTLTVKVDGVTKTEGTDYTYTDSTGTVSFATAPATDAVITATWTVPYIAKSNDYVLDIEYTLTFANGSVPS